MRVGDTLEVVITKITLGKNGKVYVTVRHDGFMNRPSLFTNDRGVLND